MFMLAAMNEVDSSSTSSSENTHYHREEYIRMSDRHKRTCQCCQRRRSNRREGKRLTFNEVTEWLDDASFERVYRVSRESFRNLVSLVFDDLVKDDSMAGTAHDGAIPVQVRVGVTLRVLAGGSALDLMQLFHIPDRTIDDIVHEVTQVFGTSLPMPAVQTDYSACRALANAMRQSRRTNCSFHGCLGAVDGIDILIHKRPEKNLPREFRSHKGFFALPLQCLVEGNSRIISFSLRFVGTTHESLSFAVLNLAALLRSGAIPFEFWVAADEAFICTENVITPYPGSEAPSGSHKDTFNYYLSSLRKHVGQAFGMLVSHWKIMKSYMQYSIRHIVSIIKATILLHNYCISRSEHLMPVGARNVSNEEEEQHWKAWVRMSAEVFDELESRFAGLVESSDIRREVSIRRRETVKLVRRLRRPRPTSRV